jgi:hypothetical protein
MITKGPWELHKYESTGRYFIKQKDSGFLEIIGDCLTNKQDAQAISAVPDMIEALQNLISYLETNYDHNEEAMKECDKALAALAKAGIK